MKAKNVLYFKIERCGFRDWNQPAYLYNIYLDDFFFKIPVIQISKFKNSNFYVSQILEKLPTKTDLNRDITAVYDIYRTWDAY